MNNQKKRDAGSSPRAQSSASLFAAAALAAGMGSACSAGNPGESVQSNIAPVIYATDSRKNLDEFNDLSIWKYADAVASVSLRPLCTDFSPPDLCFVDRDNVKDDSDLRRRLCSGQKFFGELAVKQNNCTAFLVGDDLMVTAGHCMQADNGTEADVPKCSDVELVFGYNRLGGITSSSMAVRSEIYHPDCSSAFLSRAPKGRGDHLLFRTDRPVIGHNRLRINRDFAVQPVGKRLVGLGHGLGLPLKVDDQAKVMATSSVLCSSQNRSVCDIETTHDSFGGDSGSPLIDPATGRVVGIHAGGADPAFVAGTDAQGTCSNYRVCPDATGCPNGGFSVETDIHAIEPLLVPEPPAAQAQLLADFDNDNKSDKLALQPINGTYHLTVNWGKPGKAGQDIDTTFPQNAVPPVLDLSWTLSVRDFNGDGYDDIVSAFDGFAPIYLDGQNGLIGGQVSPFSLGVSYGGFTVTDYNGDGRADLIAQNKLTGATERFFGGEHGITRAITVPSDCGTGVGGNGSSYDHAHALAVLPAGVFNLDPVLVLDCPGPNGANKLKFIDALTESDLLTKSLEQGGNWRAFAYRADQADMIAVSEGSGTFTVYRVDFSAGQVLQSSLFSGSLGSDEHVTGLTWKPLTQSVQVLVDIGDIGNPNRVGAQLRTFDTNGAAAGAPTSITSCRRLQFSGFDLGVGTGGIVAGAGKSTVACAIQSFGGESQALVDVNSTGDSHGETYITQSYTRTSDHEGEMLLHDIECDPAGGLLWGISQKGQTIYARPVDFVDTCPLFGAAFSRSLLPSLSGGGWQTGGQALGLDANRELLVTQGGYSIVQSPNFDASLLRVTGTEVDLDVMFIGPAAPAWVGDIQLFVSVPTPNNFQAIRPLSSVRAGELTTLRFPLNAAAQQALTSGAPDLRIQLAVNRPAGAPPVHLANLRFGGSLVFHTVPVPAPDLHASSRVFSFDDATAWSSAQAALAPETVQITQGTGALRVTAKGYSELNGRSFTTTGLTPSSQIKVDVRVPTQQGNPSWFGDVQAFFSCPSANQYNVALGLQALTGLSVGAYHTLQFTLPNTVRSTLAAPHDDCSFKFALNVPAGSGAYVFDNLRF